MFACLNYEYCIRISVQFLDNILCGKFGAACWTSHDVVAHFEVQHLCEWKPYSVGYEILFWIIYLLAEQCLYNVLSLTSRLSLANQVSMLVLLGFIYIVCVHHSSTEPIKFGRTVMNFWGKQIIRLDPWPITTRKIV